MPKSTALFFWVMAASLMHAAQTKDQYSSPSRPDYSYIGPFYYLPKTALPTLMEAFGDRPISESPNGRYAVTVTGPKESDRACVTIMSMAGSGHPVCVQRVSRNVNVLWRPDGKAFALTDNRYANASYVLVFWPGLRGILRGDISHSWIKNLTPVITKAVKKHMRKYYGRHNYKYFVDTLMFYVKAMRWIGNHELLVGVDARTAGPVTFPSQGIKEWYLSYLINANQNKIIREVRIAHLPKYGIGITEHARHPFAPARARSSPSRTILPAASQHERLVAFLRHYVGPLDSDGNWKTRYRSAYIDLDGQGAKDVIVYLTGRSWCGSGGCITLILAPQGTSYKVVTRLTITWPPIRVLDKTSHGWHDITVWVRGGGILPGYEALLRYNGKTYPSNPSVPPAQRLTKPLPGKIVISSKNFGTGKRIER